MSTFIQDDSIQGTTTSILSTGTNVSIFATTTNLNNLSTNSTLSINNLNATSTTIFNNLNSLSTNSTNNINSLSSNSTLSINNLIATSNTIFNNLSNLSTNSTLSINNLNNKTNFTNLLVSNSSTFVSSLNVSGRSTLNNVSIMGNLNVNGTTTIIDTVINNTAFTSFSVSGPSIYYSNITCNSSLYVSGSTNLTGAVTLLSSLNVSGSTNLSGQLSLYSNTINNYLFNNTGAGHFYYHDFNNIDKFGYTFINGAINAVINGPGTGDTQYYSWYIGLGNEYSFVDNGNGTFGMQFAIGRHDINPVLYVRRKEGWSGWTNWEGITAEKAVSLTPGNKTITEGTLSFVNVPASNFVIYLHGTEYGFGINDYTMRYNVGDWASHKFYTGSTNTVTINHEGTITALGGFIGGGAGLNSIPFTALTGTTPYLKLDGTNTMTGSLTTSGTLYVSGTTTLNNATTLLSSLNVSGITTLSNKTIINGICNIHGGDPYAVINNRMQKGSLTIGDQLLNYGGGSDWSSNTAGLMLECLDNTEIAVHDAGQRIASLMYYEGGAVNKITIGRDMVWGAISSVVLNGNITCSSSLNVISDITASGLSVFNLYATSSTIFNNLNSLSSQSYFLTNYTNLSSLNVSGTTKLNGATTCISTLNVAGNIIGSGTALTNLNYNAILNPPTIVNLNNPSTFISTLTVSGTTTLNNATTINSSLNVSGLIKSTSGISEFKYIHINNPDGRVTHFPFSGNNQNYIRGKLNIDADDLFVGGRATINSTLNVIGFTNIRSNLEVLEGITCNNITCYTYIETNRIYCGDTLNITGFSYLHGGANVGGTLTALNINATGLTITNTINVSGTTKLNNATTCISSLNVSGSTTLNNITTINSSLNVSGSTTINNITTINSTLNVSGTTKLNNATTINSTLDVVNKSTVQDLQVKGVLTIPVNNWIIDNNPNITNNQRMFFDSGAKTYFRSGGTSTSPLLDGFIFRNGQNGTDLLNIDGSGNSTQLGKLLIDGITCTSSLQVGNAGRLKIGSGTTDYTLIGTLDTDNNSTNTKIFINGNTCNYAGAPGAIQYFASAGGHVFYSSGSEKMRIGNNGNVGIGTNNPNCALEVNGICNIHGGDPYAVKNNRMQKGSLTIGDQLLNYGGGSDWTSNTAGLMFECLDNTEIAVHDAGNKVSSLMYYEGGAVNKITIGRNMFWGAIADVVLNGTITANGNKLNFPNTLDQFKINLWSTNEYGFGVAASTLQYSSMGSHSFYYKPTNTNTFTIDSSGNLSCTGNISNGSSSYIYAGGLRIGGFDGNTLYNDTRAFGITTLNNIYFSTGTSLANYKNRLVIDTVGNVGINNTSPWVDLNLGDASVAGSSGSIAFGKNNGGGGIRQFRQGYSSNFFFCLGDCGNVNSGSAEWKLQMAISYQAPESSLTISSTGSVIMPNGWTSSDERIKTNIKTIENALEKTLLLRGVEYNNFKIEPDKKCLGLIAQEVELIIPEIVSVNEMDNIKCISYNSLIGLLIEAIKDQQKQINNLKYILIKNNLN